MERPVLFSLTWAGYEHNVLGLGRNVLLACMHLERGDHYFCWKQWQDKGFFYFALKVRSIHVVIADMRKKVQDSARYLKELNSTLKN